MSGSLTVIAYHCQCSLWTTSSFNSL